MFIKIKKSGQAMVEYMMLFAMIAFITIKLVQAFGMIFSQTVGGLSGALTDQLKTGVCKDSCFFNGFKN